MWVCPGVRFGCFLKIFRFEDVLSRHTDIHVLFCQHGYSVEKQRVLGMQVSSNLFGPKSMTSNAAQKLTSDLLSIKCLTVE
jgi:hypothetical protein